MSHYKQYPQYKDSGVEWLGKIPKHWHAIRIARLGFLAKANGGSKQDNVDSGIPCVRYGELYTTHEYFIQESRSFIGEESLKDYTPIKFGDALFAASGETFEDIGKSAVNLLKQDSYCGGDIVIFRQMSNLDSLFLGYALDSTSAKAQKALMGKGYTVVHIYSDQLRDLLIALPPKPEQEIIGLALKRETARIDALIAKKTQFIQLLTKKRQALITHAVTKGLNPKAKMKDSGVGWIGEVPTHWVIVQLGKIANDRCDGPFGSGLKSEHYVDDGVRVVRLQNIGWAEFKNGNAAFIAHEHWRNVLGRGHSVVPGDLLIAGLGDDKNILGRACVATDDLGDAIVKADCYRFRLNPGKALSSFVALSLSATASAECGFMATGATRDRLNLGLASSRIVAVPPTIDEQRTIVVDIQAKTASIDLLVQKTQLSIDLLKKRRSALITAAVTGQIDLRESA